MRVVYLGLDVGQDGAALQLGLHDVGGRGDKSEAENIVIILIILEFFFNNTGHSFKV